MSPMPPVEQHQCLNVLDYLSDLFTCCGKESFTRLEILSILNTVSNDLDIFDPDVVIAHQIAIQEIDGQEDAL